MNFARSARLAKAFEIRSARRPRMAFRQKIIWSRVYARLTSHSIYGKIAAHLCLSLICAPKLSKCLSKT
jgi:hypothetical protein